MRWQKLDFEGVNRSITHIYIIQMSLACNLLLNYSAHDPDTLGFTQRTGG